MSRWLKWLLIGALLAGTSDILYATGVSYFRSGVLPSRVLQFVASGALGPSAFEGGMATAAAGLGFHYLNALIWTAIFFVAAGIAPVLLRHPLMVGWLYGAFIFVVMNNIVVPLSRIGPRPNRAAAIWVSELLVHMLLVGGSIVYAARRARG